MNIEDPAAVRTPAFAANVRTPNAGIFRGIFEQIPDLLNGNIAQFTPIYLSPGIPKEYHWIHKPAQRNATDDDLKTKALQMATILVNLSPDPASPVTQMKILMMCFARVAIIKAWSTQRADLEIAQVQDVNNNSFTSHHTAFAAAYTHAGPDAMTAAAKTATFNALVTLMTDEVNEYAAKVMHMAMGLAAATGCSLVHSQGHHFTPPTAPIFRAITRQIFKTTAIGIGAASQDDMEDALFHKACHPIKTGVLVWIARTVECGTRIKAAGLGSAAVRIPALYPTEKAKSAMMAVVNTAAAASAEHNVAMDVNVIETIAVDVDIDTSQPLTAEVFRNSEEALKRLESTHGPDIAWCAGYLSAMYENANVPQTGRSVIRAYSIRRLIEAYPASHSQGSEWYAIATRWRRNAIRDGGLPGVGLFGATPPATQSGN